jgi:hypothetical protein
MSTGSFQEESQAESLNVNAALKAERDFCTVFAAG